MNGFILAMYVRQLAQDFYAWESATRRSNPTSPPLESNHMPEVKVQTGAPKVILSLTEREASVLSTVLWSTVDHSTSPEIEALADALEEIGVSSTAVALTYNAESDMFEAN